MVHFVDVRMCYEQTVFTFWTILVVRSRVKTLIKYLKEYEMKLQLTMSGLNPVYNAVKMKLWMYAKKCCKNQTAQLNAENSSLHFPCRVY
jgi:hypothetical protein